MADQPVYKFKIGGFEAAIFLHKVEGRDAPSVVVEKSFTKDGTNWNRYSMTLLNALEIDKLTCVLQETKKALYLGDY